MRNKYYFSIIIFGLGFSLASEIDQNFYEQLRKSKDQIEKKNESSVFFKGYKHKELNDRFDLLKNILNEYKVNEEEVQFLFYSIRNKNYYFILEDRVCFFVWNKLENEETLKFKKFEINLNKDLAAALKIILKELNETPIDYKRVSKPSTTRAAIYHLFWKNNDGKFTNGYICVPAYVRDKEKIMDEYVSASDKKIEEMREKNFNLISYKLDEVMDPFLGRIHALCDKEINK